MEKVFAHQEFEGKIYQNWEKSGAFTPKVDKKQKPFTIIMPPPNANDPLHIGHAREVATQDALIRYQRMRGVPTLWLPGADHAGIETQYVFEKKLAKEGKSRGDFARETLYQMIWDYVQGNLGVMEGQLKALGASCDWTRFKFTLDPKVVEVVYQTFKNLYKDGLVYRGERIVNYCPSCATAYSQLEVETKEQDDELYFLDYGPLSIATTRPETIFADVAVAVNPQDKRFKDLIGKKAVVPLINKEIPIIADELVDPEFGTGALKITPGHDASDFAVGQKHQLSVLTVIDKRGKMMSVPDKYLGLKAAQAREDVVADLREAGKIKKTEKIHHVVGVCYKHKTPLEPLVQEQWFLKVKPLVKEAVAVMDKGEVKFTASRFEKIARHWYENLYDWNISRQIVWGIRIPAFQCGDCGKWTVTAGEKPSKCENCGKGNLVQDPDTFDTWFSSGQWPFATLKTTQPGDFDYFYPTSVMSPAYDILPFWVIRMLMLGIYETKEVPFQTVLLHGLVRDKEGQKISKSKGNVIDPIEMVKKYGADALRMATIWGALVENDNSLSEENVRGQRNFANKIWNIARFVLMGEEGKESKRKKVNKDDQWILAELKKTTKKVTAAFDKYRLNEAAEALYEFVWHKFADRYLEKTKDRRAEAQPVLEEVLRSSLKMLHPLMPFVTEAVWQELGEKEMLISSKWPSAS
ncbi:MAG: valine--tRNA ligase [Patescibacteria group bacterium]